MYRYLILVALRLLAIYRHKPVSPRFVHTGTLPFEEVGRSEDPATYSGISLPEEPKLKVLSIYLPNEILRHEEEL